MNELTSAETSTTAPAVLLAPAFIEKMLAKREDVQVIKFRTTCTDCLPNY